MCSDVPMAANANGKATKSTTMTRISQTWFASQMGPMAWTIVSRWARCRGPLASMSHTPPPKSAPAPSA